MHSLLNPRLGGHGLFGSFSSRAPLMQTSSPELIGESLTHDRRILLPYDTENEACAGLGQL